MPSSDSPACSQAEWETRQDLAACYRLFAHYGWTDLIFTHISARVPGADDQYLINPYGLLFGEITASNLIKVNFAGEVIAGDYPCNEAGHAIHAALLGARADANAVLHSHTRAGIAVSCMRCGLLPLSQHANEILGMVCYHDYDVPVDNADECERLGRDIGDKWLMILRNHGLLSLGRNIAEAFYFLYMLEIACKVQVDVMQSNADYVTPPEDVVARMVQGGMPVAEPREDVMRVWRAQIRMLNARDDSYLR